jgi:hypothetical protein
VLFHLVLAAHEFPNDNPALSDPCGVLQLLKRRGRRRDGAMSDEAPASTSAPAPPPAAPTPAPTPPPELSLAPEPTLPPPDQEDDGSDIIIVDELTPLDFELSEPPPGAADPADPFTLFVRTLVEVAQDAGCTRAAALLPALLDGGRVEPGALAEPTVDALVMTGVLVRGPDGLVAGEQFRKTAHAWRAILRGDSEDMSECGPRMLDEWAADLVARLIAAPARTEQLRRELRTRGVAAFGLVLAA